MVRRCPWRVDWFRSTRTLEVVFHKYRFESCPDYKVLASNWVK